MQIRSYLESTGVLITSPVIVYVEYLVFYLIDEDPHWLHWNTSSSFSAVNDSK